MVIHVSHTDKTDPYWIKINGECRFEIYTSQAEYHNRTAPCELRAGYNPTKLYRNRTGLWGRPEAVGYNARLEEKAARNKARMKLQAIKKSNCIEDADVVPYRHRHNAVWEW